MELINLSATARKWA